MENKFFMPQSSHTSLIPIVYHELQKNQTSMSLVQNIKIHQIINSFGNVMHHSVTIV